MYSKVGLQVQSHREELWLGHSAGVYGSWLLTLSIWEPNNYSYRSFYVVDYTEM